MKQVVKVIEEKDDKIIVGCDKSACEGCHCSMFCTNKENSFEALNPEKIDIKSGENVEIDMPSGKTIKAVLLSLGLPLILFIPGYFVGRLFTKNDLILLLWGIGFMALGFLFSSIFFKKRKIEYSPTITRKVEKVDEN